MKLESSPTPAVVVLKRFTRFLTRHTHTPYQGPSAYEAMSAGSSEKSSLIKLGIIGMLKSRNISADDIAASTAVTATFLALWFFVFVIITTSDRYISKGLSSDIKIPAQTQNLYGAFLYYSIFFHPDFTVGFGISPNQLSLAGLWIAPITAGGELHPAPKITVHLPMIISLSKDMSIVKFKLLQKVL